MRNRRHLRPILFSRPVTPVVDRSKQTDVDRSKQTEIPDQVVTKSENMSTHRLTPQINVPRLDYTEHQQPAENETLPSTSNEQQQSSAPVVEPLHHHPDPLPVLVRKSQRHRQKPLRYR